MMNTGTLKVVVQGGQAVLNNLEKYPDGTELELAIIDDLADGMSAEEHADLNEKVGRAKAQIAAGQYVPARVVIAQLRSR